jgi:L-alanine-DL-glutamate epimerase-like enolase superfamily enzyme
MAPIKDVMRRTAMAAEARIDRLDVSAYIIPTDFPEQDGTADWDKTVLVLVQVHGGGRMGLGYSYADLSTARLIDSSLKTLVEGGDALSVGAAYAAMTKAVRNIGRAGSAAMAISAVDAALWDLKARLLDVSLVDLLGRARAGTEAYGSGGFTSYPDDRLAEQLGDWADTGLRAVKMKVGRDARRDVQRVKAARAAIGPDVELYVDANGAHGAKTALAQAEAYAEYGVTWFEEPVSSDDLAGLRLVREQGPAGMRVAAGEYGYTPWYFSDMLRERAVDVLQADATRCGGVTGFMTAASIAEGCHVPLSAHTAPSLHARIGAACRNLINIEYFHDHARIEAMLFDGAAKPDKGLLVADSSSPGLGLVFKEKDASRYQHPF